ncbi:hypothetical protein [Roseomonas indoligenes]|uniref:Uncharacterized protein n=1 Tax=Roseomonas indoligenes TaxID=2820811 RepID=A0A940MW94_9PROT|nr:hypothetical protein [Pararoseomonas indoligenes]MBP0493206.1 hypothetical protein [Pararoseomonas indoligenes]
MSQTTPADDSADPAWAGAARFLEGRIPPGGRVIAPDSFARLTGALSAPDPNVLPDWAVVRTAATGALPPGLLRRLLAETTPVFANEGYVIFARRPTFGLADMRNAPAVRALADGAALGVPIQQSSGPSLLEASLPRAAAPPEAAMTPLVAPHGADIPRAALPPEALALQVPAPPRAERPAFPVPHPGAAAPEPPRLFVPPPEQATPPRLFLAPVPGNAPPIPAPAPSLFAVPPVQPPAQPQPSFTPPPAPAPAPRPEANVPPVPVPMPARSAPPVPEPPPAPAHPVSPTVGQPRAPDQEGTLPARVAASLGTGAGNRVAALGRRAPALAGAALARSALVSEGSEGQPDACFDLALLTPDEASLAGLAAEAARLLRPGGRLLVVAENATSLGRRLSATLGRPAPAGMSVEAIRGALHAAGLIPERLEGHALDSWRATSDAPPPGLAAGDPAAAILEEAAETMDPRHAAWLLFLARKP